MAASNSAAGTHNFTHTNYRHTLANILKNIAIIADRKRMVFIFSDLPFLCIDQDDHLSRIIIFNDDDRIIHCDIETGKNIKLKNNHL